MSCFNYPIILTAKITRWGCHTGILISPKETEMEFHMKVSWEIMWNVKPAAIFPVIAAIPGLAGSFTFADWVRSDSPR